MKIQPREVFENKSDFSLLMLPPLIHFRRVKVGCLLELSAATRRESRAFIDADATRAVFNSSKLPNTRASASLCFLSYRKLWHATKLGVQFFRTYIIYLLSGQIKVSPRVFRFLRFDLSQILRTRARYLLLMLTLLVALYKFPSRAFLIHKQTS